MECPKDMLGLFAGHQLDFFLGDKVNLRDRIGRSLPEWDRADPERGFLLGMLAFGLEETGWYERAEREGLAALDQHPEDVWAFHAVVHVHEMRGDVKQGLGFMEERAAHWEDGNFFNVHNFWHKALYLLDLEAYDSVLDIYDHHLHNKGSQGVALEMLDAASLLWRLYLEGRDERERFSNLADAWEVWYSGRGRGRESTRSTETTEPDHAGRDSFYVFNDCHAIMALVGAGRIDEARAIVADLGHAAGRDDDTILTNASVIRRVGLPVSRAIVAFAEGGYGQVVDELLPIRNELAAFGGSDAQRDVVQRTLLEAALRDGQLSLARNLINERLTLKPGSNFNAKMGLRIRSQALMAANSQAKGANPT
jgi:tetratricopeptide (TPR) repeat protein